MKFTYKAALLICSSVFAMSVQAAGMPQSSKHAQRGVNCTQCHTTGKFEPVETKQCQTCHNQDQLAQKTDRLNYISRMKNPKTKSTSPESILMTAITSARRKTAPTATVNIVRALTTAPPAMTSKLGI